MKLQAKFMEGVKEVCTSQLLAAVSELCHMDTSLAEWVWLQLFPRIWKILSEKQQQVRCNNCKILIHIVSIMYANEIAFYIMIDFVSFDEDLYFH